MGDSAIPANPFVNERPLDAKINISNKNEMNWIGNAAGEDRIDKKIDRKLDNLIDRVASKDQKEKIEGMMQNIQTGEGLTAEQHKQLNKIAEALSPGELNDLVKEGKISQEIANFLIIADGLKDAGVSGDAKGRGLAKFLGMQPDVQKYSVETMGDRTTKRTVKAENNSEMMGLIRHDKVKIKEKDEDLNAAQQRLAVFLSGPYQGPGHAQHFVNGNFDTARETLMGAFADLPAFRNMPREQQAGMIDFFHQLGTGGALAGHQPVDIKGPDYFQQMGLSKDEVVELATLMYQVLADRVSTLDQQVRVFAKGVQQKNDELKTLNSAMNVVNDVAKEKKKTDLSEVTFQDASGHEVLLADYLAEQKIGGKETKLSKADSVKINSILTGLKNQSDVLSSESTQAMTKLQQAMDKYNQATTTQTNLQSKFNTLQMSVRRNLAQ